MAVEALGSTPRARVAPWNDPVIRGWVFQIVVVGLVGMLAWYLVSNTMENLERQKIASGFHYLDREAGAIDFASINDLPISESDRLFKWDRRGPRPADYPSLSDFGL